MLTEQEATNIADKEFQFLDSEISKTKGYEYPPVRIISHITGFISNNVHEQTQQLQGKWKGFVQSATVGLNPDTGVNTDALKTIATKSVEHPNIVWLLFFPFYSFSYDLSFFFLFIRLFMQDWRSHIVLQELRRQTRSPQSIGPLLNLLLLDLCWLKVIIIIYFILSCYFISLNEL